MRITAITVAFAQALARRPRSTGAIIGRKVVRDIAINTPVSFDDALAAVDIINPWSIRIMIGVFSRRAAASLAVSESLAGLAYVGCIFGILVCASERRQRHCWLGLRKTTRGPRVLCRPAQTAVRRVRDGFLRSFEQVRSRPRSLVSDELGIYMQQIALSDLASSLGSDDDLLDGIGATCRRAMDQILECAWQILLAPICSPRWAAPRAAAFLL